MELNRLTIRKLLPTSRRNLNRLAACWSLTLAAISFAFVVQTAIAQPAGPPATNREQSRMSANQAFAEGKNLQAEWTEQSLRRAIEKYEEARALWKSIGDARNEAAANQSIGDVSRLLNEPQKALEHYRAALRMSKSVGNRARQSEILGAMGYVYFSLAQNNQARSFGLNALQLARDTKNRFAEAQAFDVIGESHYGLGEARKALDSYERAESVWRDLADSPGQALALLHSGYVYSDMSNSQRAMDAYRRSLELWRTGKNSWGEAHTLTAIGHLKSKLGQKQEALEAYRDARALFKPLGDRVGEGFILNGMGYVYDELGEAQKALEFYEQALQLFLIAKYRLGEAGSRWRIGRIYYSLGEYDKALAYYEASRQTFRQIKNRHSEQFTLNDIGMVYDSLGNREKALNHYHQALQLNRVESNQREEAYTLNLIGRVYEVLGKKEKALSYYTKALKLNNLTKDRFGESRTLYNIARAQRSLGRLSEANTTIQQALKLVESLRGNVSSETLRSSYFASARQFYELNIDLLMQLERAQPLSGFNVMAFNVSEQARARSLLETLHESRADILQSVDANLLAQERELQTALNLKALEHAQLVASRKDGEAETTAKEIDRLTTQYDQLKAEIKAKSPRYASLTQPQPLTVSQIQQQVLDDDSILLEYMLGEERSYVWAVTRTEITGHELPARAKIESAARKFRELLTVNQPLANETFQQLQTRIREADAQIPAAAAALSDILIGPVHDKLERKRLIVVADGALHYIPFQALMVPTTVGNPSGSSERVPLLFNHEIVYEPSASALALLLNERTRRKPGNSIAVFANPVFESDDPRVKSGGIATATQASSQQATVREVFRDLGLSDGRVPALPASRDEANAIMSFAPWGTGLKALGFEANRATATRPELAEFRIVHFATHGFVDYEHPELSGLVLSLVNENGQPQDGYLRLHDIYNLKLSSDLVVLSACNTGIGKEIKGEGLIGLTRGFMYAGAGGVAASLWKVDDEATAELMTRFYEGMFRKGLTPPAAMREAQLWMWQQKRWRAPYYWAAFIIQGRYDQTESLASTSRAQWLVTSAGLFSAFFLAACLIRGRRRTRSV